jgi:hypothetical protein
MHERSRDIYKIQGKVQQEGNTTQYNSPGRGNFNPRGGFKGRGRGGGMGQGRGKFIYYNYAQSGHLARDFQNPCTTCNYWSSFDHVIEDCPMFLAKLQERRGPQQNPQVKLIYVEPYGEDPRVVVITKGGVITGDDRMTQGKTTEDSRIRKATQKTQMFDAKKERKIFEEARKEFRGDQGYSLETRPEVREYGMPLAFDQSTSPKEGKEVSKLMEFLYTCIKLIQDESIVQELQNLIRQYELGKIDPLLNREVHQISKKRRTNKELYLNAQIGEYEIDYVVLDLGSEVNVMTKQT